MCNGKGSRDRTHVIRVCPNVLARREIVGVSPARYQKCIESMDGDGAPTDGRPPQGASRQGRVAVTTRALPIQDTTSTVYRPTCYVTVRYLTKITVPVPQTLRAREDLTSYSYHGGLDLQSAP